MDRQFDDMENSQLRSTSTFPDADTQAVTTCELRVITTAAELVESYRLRYEVYRELGYLQCFNRSQLDIDPYDAGSIPFGAFDARSGMMIGTLRLITTECQPVYEHLINRILTEASDRELTDHARAPRPRLLPSIVSDAAEQQIKVYNTESFAVHELSRFIVDPRHRGSGIARGLVLLGIAHAMRPAPAILIAGCLPEHNQMHARYGFARLPHTGLDYFDCVGQIANTIIARTDRIPQPTQCQIDQMLCAMASGAPEHTLKLGRDLRALYRFSTPRQVRRGAAG
jgi:N-acyl-L-homoserine lactone synthetase